MIAEVINGIVIELDALPEPAPIEGNCSAIDDDVDAETAAHIREALDNGNQWAWCYVQVTAALPGIEAEGTAYLGCCSYLNAESFRTDGYYADMVIEALYNLVVECPDHAHEIDKAISIVESR